MRARFFLAVLVMLVPGLGLAQPKVMASILPIHSLAAAVMEGVGEPKLIVSGAVSEHSYVMKPSDAQALREADIVFWMGKDLEGFLTRPLRNLKKGARAEALVGTRGLTLHKTREGGPWEGHDDGHKHSHAHNDPHVWLSVDNAKVLAARMASVLAAADPANAARYQENEKKLAARLDALKAELTATLAPARAKPFIVFHDGYQYFEKEFGLRGVGSVTVSPERPPGAQRIAALRKKIAELGAVCVFAEPQYDPRSVEALLGQGQAKAGQIDATGANIAPGAQAYEALMRRLAADFVKCLA